MRRIIFIVLLLCAAPAYAGPLGGFNGTVTSFQTLTPQGTYVNALGTLGNLTISASISLNSTSFLTNDLCSTNPIGINCVSGNCASPIEVYVSSGAGSFDNYDGNDSCPNGYISVISGPDGLSGSVVSLGFYPNTGPAPYTYDKMTLNFQGPSLPATATLLDFMSYSWQWTGSGTFLRYTQNAQFKYTAGYKGAFEVVPASQLPEPGALALFAAGIAGLIVALRRRPRRGDA